MRFTFIDKEQLCVYENGKIEKYESVYLSRYKENSQRDLKNKEWKKNSDAMLYEDFFENKSAVVLSLNSISPTVEKNKFIYSFSVNQTSGIYYKFTDDEKKTEAHLVSSNEETFLDIAVSEDGKMCGTIQKNAYASNIAVFSKQDGSYKCVTGGDSKDENPFFLSNGEILFNSYGIARDVNNQFIKYMPSEILKINPFSQQIETLVSDEGNSYIKPILDSEGNLYCIKKIGEEKEKNNFLIDMLLIPVRIIEAIVAFVSAFVTFFTGKSLLGNKGKTRSGGVAAKNIDEQKIFIHNHLLNVEKELKRNEKEKDGGFIPRSFKLVKIKKNQDTISNQYDHGMAETLVSGVADFCIIEENDEKIIVYTNGKRIFALRENGERKKLVNTDFCVKLGALQASGYKDEEDLFNRL